ncbi:MAG: AAA family ATPase [Dehalococcoidia bacterium]|nr:AAA family ATPase [Dehalococcoidia bacterium]
MGEELKAGAAVNVLARLRNVHKAGAGWQARCPSHEDEHNSLSISNGSKALLLHCHAGCTPEAVLNSIGLRFTDLYPPAPERKGKPQIVKTYSFRDLAGQVLHQTVRYEPKDFKQRRPNGAGWDWSLKGVQTVVYNLRAVTDAIGWGEMVHVCEGEKDCDKLADIGLVSTTNPLGAGKWRKHHSEHLRHAHVVILPDNDQAGRDHGQAVATSLQGLAATVKVLELPGLQAHGDVSDWIEAGGTAEELRRLVEQAPLWTAGGKGTGEDQERQDRGKALAPLTLVSMADVQPEKVEWLWPPYIPLAKVTCLEGDPGLGKSWISLAISTGVSLGRGLPGMMETDPANILILTAEDGLGDTVRPRLDAMGADVTRVFALDGPATLDEAGLVQVERHIAALRPALVVYDPLVAYLGSGVDLHRSNETRPVMAALSRLAEKYTCAILVIRHLTKGGRDKAIYRGIGSIDITGACRSVLLAGCDPTDPKKRGIIQTKSNLAEFGPAVGYHLEDGNLFWTGATDLTASRILAPDDTGERRSALEEAIDFLKDALSTGERMVPEVQKEAHGAGIKEMTLDRAKAQLGIRARRHGEQGKRGGGAWYWVLPDGLEPQNDLECQTSRVENLTPLIISERKDPSDGGRVDTLNQGEPPFPWVQP